MNFYRAFVVFLFLLFLFHDLDLGLGMALFSFWFRKSCKLGCFHAHDSKPCYVLAIKSYWIFVLHLSCCCCCFSYFNDLDLGLGLPLFLFWFKKSCRFNYFCIHDNYNIKRNVVHSDHIFATTIQLMSKPTNFMTISVLVLRVHVVANIGRVEPNSNYRCNYNLW